MGILNRFYVNGVQAGFFGLVLLGLAAAPTFAQMDWDTEISIDLKKAPLSETLASFAKIAGGTAALDPEVKGEVTLLVKSAPVFEILDRICREHALQCFWGGLPSQLVVRPASGFRGFATSISLRLKRADLQKTLMILEKITGDRIRIDGKFEGKVMLEILGAPWPVVLAHLCEDSGCVVDWSRDPALVTPKASKAYELKTPIPGADPSSFLREMMDTAPIGLWGPLRLEVQGTPEPSADLFDLPIFSSAKTPAPHGKGAASSSTWGEAIGSLCEGLRCRWQLRYGSPSSLLLTWLDPRAEGQVVFGDEQDWDSHKMWKAGELASRLALETNVELRAAATLKMDREVKVRRHKLSWIELADTLCRVLHCDWRLEGEALHLTPSGAPLSLFPTVSMEPTELLVTVQGKKDSASMADPIQDRETLDWRNPVYRRRWDGVAIRSSGKSAARESSAPKSSGIPASGAVASEVSGWVFGIWIPFSTDQQWVLPVWQPCDGQGGRTFPPVRVEAASAAMNLAFDFRLMDPSSRSTPATSSSRSEGLPAAEPCSPATSPKRGLMVEFAELDGEEPIKQTRFSLRGQPGEYVLVAPPGDGAEGASIAVIYLGRGRESVERETVAVAIMRLQADSEPWVEFLALDTKQVESFSFKGRSYRLTFSPH